jgi:hypothetical protein
MGQPLKPPNDADWFACPSCGAEVQVGSRGCSKCSKNTPKSWAEEPHLDGVSLPDDPDDFDYNDFVNREFGRPSSIKPPHLAWKWWLTAIILLALMITGLISNW